MVKVAFDWVKQPLGIIKLVGLAVSTVTLILYFEYPFTFKNSETYSLSVVAIPANFMVLAYFVISYIFDENKPGKHFITELIFDLVHAIFNVIIGGFAVDVDFCINCDGVKAFGAMAIILAVVLLVDAFFTFKKRE